MLAVPWRVRVAAVVFALGCASPRSAPIPGDAAAAEAGTADTVVAGCVDGKKRCSEQTPQICVSGQWISEAQPCRGSACTGDGVCTGECEPHARRCGSGAESAWPFLCGMDGRWRRVGQACAGRCEAGVCTGACRPSESRCTADGKGVEVCGATGTWGPGESCGAAACADGKCQGGACAPGEKRCSRTALHTPQVCEKGAWVDQTPCLRAACVDGSCVGVCAPGSIRCTGADQRAAQACGPDGAWEAQVTVCPGVCSDGNQCQEPSKCHGCLDATPCGGRGQRCCDTDTGCVCREGARDAFAYCIHGCGEGIGAPCCWGWDSQCKGGLVCFVELGRHTCQLPR